MSLPERLRDKSLQFSDIEAGKVLAEKAAGFSTIWPLFQDVDKYRVLLAQAEQYLPVPPDPGPELCHVLGAAGSLEELCCLLLRPPERGRDV